MKAIIFDMDGVLIDSEPLWKIAEVEGFGKVGLDLTHTDCEETVGLRIDEVVKLWYNKRPWEGKSLEVVTQDIIDILIREVLKQGTTLPGVQEALNALKDDGYKIGLATSSSKAIIAAVMQRLNIESYFDAIHSAEDEILGKPHPAVFLTCAQKLGVEATDCWVVEDSFNGMVAAKAARMKVIGVPEKTHQMDKRFVIADIQLDSLEDLNIQDL